MDLSIIIVNWNSLDFTISCVASITECVRDLEYEVIVVDNASLDGACLALKEMYPTVVLICLDQNIGFARANNIGAAASHGSNILFLNPDTKVLEDAIQTMVSALGNCPEIGAVGCRLLNRDLTLQTSCVQRFPTILNQIFGLGFLQRFRPTADLLGLRALHSEEANLDVEVVSGACLMVKRDAFDAVGEFSSDYFMYAEEADLCYKLRRAEWKVRFVRDAQIVHYGGQSTKKLVHLSSEVMMRDSVFRLLRKFRGGAYARAYRIGLLLSAIVRLLLICPVLLIPTPLLDRDRIFWAFRKWARIASWSISMNGRT
jgi:GT2 family glycosyltransferase